jgi:hypothetical protein
MLVSLSSSVPALINYQEKTRRRLLLSLRRIRWRWNTMDCRRELLSTKTLQLQISAVSAMCSYSTQPQDDPPPYPKGNGSTCTPLIGLQRARNEQEKPQFTRLSPGHQRDNGRHVTCTWWDCRSQGPRGLKRRSASAWLLGSQVRIPVGTWMFVSCVYMLCCPV